MCNVQPDLQNFITEKLMNIWIWDVWLLWPPPEVTALDETYGNMNLKH